VLSFNSRNTNGCSKCNGKLPVKHACRPCIKLTGINTAAITSVMETITPEISLMVWTVAFRAGNPVRSILAMHGFYYHNSIVTTIPIANTSANKVAG
jgi:hypothetical protein